jgi:HEPN domain-containing protein
MNRQDFKKIALIRLKEARVLLDNQKWDGAYYLCGYSVECALKACIAKTTKQYDFPPKRNVIEMIYKHDITSLFKAAGLEAKLDKYIKAKKDKKLERNLNFVLNWNEESRYSTHSQKDAEILYEAITNKSHGVLSWIKQRW